MALLGLRDTSALRGAPAFCALLEALSQARLTRVLQRMVKDTGVSVQEAEHARDTFFRFMALSHHLQQDLAPPADADAFWHVFLLFTSDYADFCQRHFGHFVHHEPFDDTTPAQVLADTRLASDLIPEHFTVTHVPRRQLPPCARG